MNFTAEMKQPDQFTDFMLDRSIKLRAVIVGTDTECAEMRNALCISDRFEVFGNVDPYTTRFLQYINSCNPDLIINASTDPSVDTILQKIKSSNCNVLSALNAKLLFCSVVPNVNKSNTANFRAKVLHGLKDLCHSAYLTRDIKECLTLILSVAINSLNADSGSVMLTDPKKRMLKIEMAHGIDEAIISNTEQKIGKGIAGKVACTGKPLLLNGKPEESASIVERQDLISSISVPLLINNQAIGVLNLSSKKSCKIFDYDDLKYAADLAQFAAGVIDSSREYQKTKQTSTIHSLLSSTRDILHLNYPLQERLNLLMMKLVNSLNGRICNLYQFDKESKTFYIQASSYYDLNRRYTQMIRLNDFFTGRILRCQEQFTYFAPLKKLNLQKCFIAQPLFSNKEISGLILLQLIAQANTQLETEKELLKKIALYLEREFTQLSLLEGARLNLIKYSAFSEISSDFSTIHNIRHIARLIVINTCLLFEAENCILSLYNDVMTCFEVLESFSLRGQSHIRQLERTDKIITSEIINYTSPVLIPDLSSVGFLREQTSAKSVISMCLRLNGRIMGSLSIYDKSKYSIHDQTSFNSQDRELFKDFSLQIIRMLNRFLCFR